MPGLICSRGGFSEPLGEFVQVEMDVLSSSAWGKRIPQFREQAVYLRDLRQEGQKRLDFRSICSTEFDGCMTQSYLEQWCRPNVWPSSWMASFSHRAYNRSRSSGKP